MKRKIILLVGTFLAVLAVVGVFKLLAPDFIYGPVSGTDNPGPGLVPGDGVGETGPTSDRGSGLKIIETETTAAGGRPKRIYYVEEWFKRDDGVYVLTGPKFAASCIIQYLDDDFEDVKPLLLETLNSFRAVR